jgi:hypothetical protein
MTTTPTKGYVVPTVGADFGTWGNELNGDLGIIDNNLGGMNSISVAGNSNVTATGTQMQNLVQKLTGTLTGNIFYLMPSVQGFWIIQNATSGALTVTVANTTGGGGVAVTPACCCGATAPTSITSAAAPSRELRYRSAAIRRSAARRPLLER